MIGVDINPQVVATLRNGGLHIHEPGLRTLVQAALGSGKLIIAEQPQPADAYIIAVPTPFYGNSENVLPKRADMSYVISAAESLLPYLRPGNLVVLESTSPPRTTIDLLAPILERSGLKAGVDFQLAYVPERVLPGQILRELIENGRVIGGIDRASAEAGSDLYSIFVRGEVILTDATTAEMVKLMENTSRDVNVAIANEFSRLAERFGIDVWEAIDIANHHPRVKILRPGPGVGGHCIGVDPWFLVEAAPDLTPLVQAARQVNDSQPQFTVQLIRQAFGAKDLAGKNIAMLGLAYKSDVDDLRESPAIEVARQLEEAGAIVRAYEPFKPKAEIPGIQTSEYFRLEPTLEAAIQNADLLALMVAHTPLVGLIPSRVAELTPARLVVDVVSGWSQHVWEAAGFQVYRLGVGNKL